MMSSFPVRPLVRPALSSVTSETRGDEIGSVKGV